MRDTDDIGRLTAWCSARGVSPTATSPSSNRGRDRSARGYLADRLCTPAQTVGHWLSGRRPVPSWVWLALNLIDHQSADSPHRRPEDPT